MMLETLANLVITTSILLAARNSVHTWWTGIVGCVLFTVLFADAKLYADALLQVFFIATSAYGWWHWSDHPKGERPIASASVPTVVAGGVTAAAVAVSYGWALDRFTDAAVPFADAAVLSLSVVAQVLLMRRCTQTWLFWLAVNTIAVPLFASRGLWITSALYAAYWVNALYGFSRWRRLAVMP